MLSRLRAVDQERDRLEGYARGWLRLGHDLADVYGRTRGILPMTVIRQLRDQQQEVAR